MCFLAPFFRRLKKRCYGRFSIFTKSTSLLLLLFTTIFGCLSLRRVAICQEGRGEEEEDEEKAIMFISDFGFGFVVAYYRVFHIYCPNKGTVKVASSVQVEHVTKDLWNGQFLTNLFVDPECRKQVYNVGVNNDMRCRIIMKYWELEFYIHTHLQRFQ